MDSGLHPVHLAFRLDSEGLQEWNQCATYHLSCVCWIAHQVRRVVDALYAHEGWAKGDDILTMRESSDCFIMPLYPSTIAFP